jgi:hypothetical protein
VTDYDRAHAAELLRLLDAADAGAPWDQAVEAIFGVDPASEPNRARRVYDSHLARAKWLAREGYRQLLRPRSS